MSSIVTQAISQLNHRQSESSSSVGSWRRSVPSYSSSTRTSSMMDGRNSLIGTTRYIERIDRSSFGIRAGEVRLQNASSITSQSTDSAYSNKSRPLSLATISSNLTSAIGEELNRRSNLSLSDLVDQPFRNSLLRATEALKASERCRKEDEEKLKLARTSIGPGEEALTPQIQALTTSRLQRHDRIRNSLNNPLPPLPTKMPSKSVTFDTLPTSSHLLDPQSPVKNQSSSRNSRLTIDESLPLHLPVPPAPQSKFSLSSQEGDSGLPSDTKKMSNKGKGSTVGAFRSILKTPASMAHLFGGSKKGSLPPVDHSAPTTSKSSTSSIRQPSSSSNFAHLNLSSSLNRSTTSSNTSARRTPKTSLLRAAFRDFTGNPKSQFLNDTASESGGFASRSVTSTEGKENIKKSWVGRFGQAVGGKRGTKVEEEESPTPVIRFSEKMIVPTSARLIRMESSSRKLSRLPTSTRSSTFSSHSKDQISYPIAQTTELISNRRRSQIPVRSSLTSREKANYNRPSYPPKLSINTGTHIIASQKTRSSTSHSSYTRDNSFESPRTPPSPSPLRLFSKDQAISEGEELEVGVSEGEVHSETHSLLEGGIDNGIAGEFGEIPSNGVFNATSDLAHLLSVHEDTTNFNNSEISLPGISTQIAQELRTIDLMDSRYSIASNSDVPEDLRELIQTVDDHISDIEDRESVHEDSKYVHIMNHLEVEANSTYTSGFLRPPSRVGSDETGSSSFEGLFTTAATALGNSSQPLELTTDISGLRASVRDCLAMARPTVGEKMMDERDYGVSLESLVDGDDELSAILSNTEADTAFEFRPRSTYRDSNSSSSDSNASTGSSMESPLPVFGLRSSLARYSADRNRITQLQNRPQPNYSSSNSNSDSDMEVSSSTSGSDSSDAISIAGSASPCPTRTRRAQMLTGNASTSVPDLRFGSTSSLEVDNEDEEERFRSRGSHRVVIEGLSPFKELFVPLNEFSRRNNSRGSTESLDVPVSVQPSPSPRQHVRPQVSSNKSSPSSLVPLDTPPPSAPPSSASSDRSSLDSCRVSSVELEKATHVTITRGLSRQFSMNSKRRSSIINDTILEEEDENIGPQGPKSEGKSLEVILESISAEDERRSSSGLESSILETRRAEQDDQHHMEILRKYSQLTHEAEVEIWRSKDLYPDTERSREVIAGFDPPEGVYEILQFLFDSQDRFRSIAHLYSNFASTFFDTKISTDVTDLSTQTSVPVNLSPVKPKRTKKDKPELVPAPPATRLPFADKPRIVNHQRNKPISISVDSLLFNKKDLLSPFTALPPKLAMSKLRSRLSSPSKSLNNSTLMEAASGKENVSSFLGPLAATKRRQDQFAASLRKLEGVGTAEEQRSDEGESDDSELIARGSLGGIGGFKKTPKQVTSRAKVRRRAGISGLR